MKVFEWNLQSEPSATERVSIRSVSFGDGYEQSVANGLNPIAKDWDLRFKGRISLIRAIDTFLAEHIGKAFLWENPLGDQGMYKSEGKNIVMHTANIATLTVKFKQCFHP